MSNVPPMDRMVAVFFTAFSVVAAMGLLGMDVLWLLDEKLPVTGRVLVEWQIAPFMACGLVALAAWTGRRDQRADGNQSRINRM